MIGIIVETSKIKHSLIYPEKVTKLIKDQYYWEDI